MILLKFRSTIATKIRYPLTLQLSMKLKYFITQFVYFEHASLLLITYHFAVIFPTSTYILPFILVNEQTLK